jgi:catechol 2,3-dioxygenase-like lactoylglutathione lyase family enzyme
MKAQPLISVRDVRASAAFYERLLGCKDGHGGTEYARLYDPEVWPGDHGTTGLLLQLHAFDVDHHHGHMGDPDALIGNGVLIWFEIDDFDAAVVRAKELAAPIVLDVHHNPNARHRELWVKDPDGYTVVIASHDGEPAPSG